MKYDELFERLPPVGKLAQQAIALGVEEKHHVSRLEELGISQRLLNLFEEQGIEDLGDLMRLKKESLMSFPNFGEKQLVLLFDALSKYHLIDDSDMAAA
jgi:DNA-directed RNA polymerase alpha subunit